MITSTEPRVCYKCGELNHLARSCTAIIDGEVSGAGPRKNLGPKTCYKVRLIFFEMF